MKHAQWTPELLCWRQFDDSCWKTDDRPSWSTIFGTQISSPVSSSCSWRNPSKCMGSSRPVRFGGIVLEENSNAEEMSSFSEGKIAPLLGNATERLRAKTQADADAEGRAWKLFGMVLLMLLHRLGGTGTVGRGELAARASKFAAGKWSELIEEACQCETQVNQTRKWFIVQKKRGEAGLPRVACNKDKCPGLVRS